MNKKNRGSKRLLFSAIGVALAFPLVAVPASAAMDGGNFFVHAQNTSDDQFQANAGMKGTDSGGSDGGDTPVVTPVSDATGVCASGYEFTAPDSWQFNKNPNADPFIQWTGKNLDSDGNLIHSDDTPSDVLMQNFQSGKDGSEGDAASCRILYKSADGSATRSGDRPALLQFESAYNLHYDGEDHSFPAVAKAAWNDLTIDDGGVDSGNMYLYGHRSDLSKPFSLQFNVSTGKLIEARYRATRVSDGEETINTITCDGTGYESCSTDNRSQDDVFTQERYDAIGTLASYPELAKLSGK